MCVSPLSLYIYIYISLSLSSPSCQPCDTSGYEHESNIVKVAKLKLLRGGFGKVPPTMCLTVDGGRGFAGREGWKVRAPLTVQNTPFFVESSSSPTSEK